MKTAKLLNPLAVAVLLLGALSSSHGAPVNDNFANRTVLTGTNVTASGTTSNATAEANEPEHSALPNAQHGSRRTVWWSWTAANANAVVISVLRTNGDFPSPMLAVWNGTALASLSIVASNFSGQAECRVVFVPTAGQAYQIAVDDNGFDGADDGTRFRLNLRTFPPPANDNFANRITIPGLQMDASTSFLGASREASEPSHGIASLPQTLWWTWTAPPGVLTNRVTCYADSVNYPPDLVVYTGSTLPTLLAVPGITNAFGMTRLMTFLAVPGTTYQIGLAGRQTDPTPNSAATNYGQVRLRFNASTLALVITNRTALTNQDFSSPFFETTLLTNGLRVENWGNASTRVRVRLEASPGYGARGDAIAPPFPAVSNLFISATVTVAQAQSVSMLATGRCPAPYNPEFDFDHGIGWGVYAILEEQVGSAWFAVDHQLAGFGLWPDVGGFNGPGGGVVRIDPQAGSGSLCIPQLQLIQINGPAGILEGNTTNFSATAMFNCPSNINFNQTIWSNSLVTSTVTTNGVLRAGSVTNNTVTTVHCFFEYRGVLSNASRQLIITNLPSPMIGTRARLPNGNFQMSGTGVAGRRHSIQGSTNLCCASNWLTLTLTDLIATNGTWNFTDTNAPAHLKRFYRVRELE